MSNPSMHSDAPTEEHERVSLATLRQRAERPIRFVGFWLSVALPFLYLPLLATGLNTVSQTIAFLGLLALNVVALAVGHSYQPE
ncbi:MAG: hypothetical protein ACLFR6_05365 [Salinarchaeum sp.]